MQIKKGNHLIIYNLSLYFDSACLVCGVWCVVSGVWKTKVLRILIFFGDGRY